MSKSFKYYETDLAINGEMVPKQSEKNKNKGHPENPKPSSMDLRTVN
jgi:hypothetical protein